LTVHSHFQIENQPLRRLLDEFKKWLHAFISEKQTKIRELAAIIANNGCEEEVVWRES
jgi:hypothetical protein